MTKQQIPTSFDQVTIEQYQHCYGILKQGDGTDQWIDVLTYFTGLERDYFEELPLGKLQEQIGCVKFLLSPNEITKVNDHIIVAGQTYRGITDIAEGNFAQYSSIKTVLSKCPEGDTTFVLHKLLACIYTPVKLFGKDYDMPDVAEKMKQAKVGQVLGLVFFYSKVFNALTEVIQIYLEATNPPKKESSSQGMS